MNPNDTNQNDSNQNNWQSSGNVDPNLAQPYNPWSQDTLAQNITPPPQQVNPTVQEPVEPVMPPQQPMQDQPVAPVQQVPNTPAVNPSDDEYEMVPRDPNVLNFMTLAVRQKLGETADPLVVKKEAERLYDEFGEKLVDYFEPMLSKEQIEQFDNLMAQNASQDQLLAFLMSSIPDLTQQIEKVLLEFKEKYIYGF